MFLINGYVTMSGRIFVQLLTLTWRLDGGARHALYDTVDLRAKFAGGAEWRRV